MKRRLKKGLIIFLGIILIFLLFYFLNNNGSQQNSENFVKFSFISNETNIIDGEIFFDNILIGNTTEGIIKIYPLNETPKEIEFMGYYNDKKFRLYYNFPEDYLNYSEVPFTYTLQSIKNFINIEEDNFPETDKLHYPHMPIIYKYFNSCGYTEKNKIEYAFREITNSTNNSVTFLEGDNYDMLLNCAISLEGKTSYAGDYYYNTLGEGSPTELIGNIILKANITFYPFIDACGYYPFVELHEILHALGYEWNLYEQWHYPRDYMCSIMTNETNCQLIYENPTICGKPQIDKEIVDNLIKIYS